MQSQIQIDKPLNQLEAGSEFIRADRYSNTKYRSTSFGSTRPINTYKSKQTLIVINQIDKPCTSQFEQINQATKVSQHFFWLTYLFQ